MLSEDEIRGLWKALDSEDAVIAAVFRLRLLTAQRGGEVLGDVGEMDLRTGWWTIRRRSKQWRNAPLSSPAVKASGR